MKSQWFEYKAHALSLRKNGMSITYIERTLGIPRSTLSGWFKEMPLSSQQRVLLQKNKHLALASARKKAAAWHHEQKRLRIATAREEAEKTLKHINTDSSAVLELAFAMLYFGEGKKSQRAALSSSDPDILRFVVTVLRKVYGVKAQNITCELHLRADQRAEELKKYWGKTLGIPPENFTGIFFDKRTAGRPSYGTYQGVCVVHCGGLALQRKLMYLYNLFCEQVVTEHPGGD